MRADETIYKRDDKRKNEVRKVKTKAARLRFKDRSVNINRTITIGRDARNDIALSNDPLVSRQHALIEKEGGIYYLMDRGSTNGTYLNNNPIPKCERVRIKSGDVIMIGKTKLEIV